MAACWGLAVARTSPWLERIILFAGAAIVALFLAAAIANRGAVAAATLESFPGTSTIVALNGLGFVLLHPWMALLGLVAYKGSQGKSWT